MILKKETVDALGGLISSTFAADDLSLEVIDGPHQGQALRLDKEFLRIGRAEWCDLALPDDSWVSNVHCDCRLDERGIRIRDLESRNGIQIEGVPVYDARMKVGATLTVGRSVIRLKSHNKKRELKVLFRNESGTLVGKSAEMRRIFSLLSRLGERKVSTLLLGETGTGKTSIARSMHDYHADPNAPFVTVNCSALPAGLIEAALFGHEKGAFTGADRRHIGFFEQANGGTLFLDEIAELPLELQPKLLDVLERRCIRRLGGEKEYPVDFHLITATHRDLKKACKAKLFREDLYFRSAVMELFVPSLRSRKEDISLLAEVFLSELGGGRVIYITERAIQELEAYSWPGNIRQLRNVLERTIALLSGDIIDVSELLMPQDSEGEDASPTSHKYESDVLTTRRTHIVKDSFPVFPLSQHTPHLSLKDILAETERILLAQALEETNHRPRAAAKLLNISESWLYNRIKRYGISDQQNK